MQGVTELEERERCKDDWWNEVVGRAAARRAVGGELALPPRQARRRLPADRGRARVPAPGHCGAGRPALGEKRSSVGGGHCCQQRRQIPDQQGPRRGLQPRGRVAAPLVCGPGRAVRRGSADAGAGGSGRKRSGRKGSSPARAGVRQGRADPVASVSRPGHREPLRHAAASRRNARGLGRPPQSLRGQAPPPRQRRPRPLLGLEGERPATCVYVKFDGAAWQLDGAPEPGLYPVYPARKVWKLDAKRKKPVLKIARTQLPGQDAACGASGLQRRQADRRDLWDRGCEQGPLQGGRLDLEARAGKREGGGRGKGGKQKQVASPQAVRALALHAWRAGGPAARRGGELGSLQGGEGALRGVREMQRGQDAGLLLRSAVGARPGQPLGHLPCLRPRQGRAEDAEAEAALRPGALGLPRV